MFYLLEPAVIDKENIVYGTVGGESDTNPIWETRNCPKCRRPISMYQINNLRIELSGEELQSIIWTDDGPLFSDLLVQALMTSNLHGFIFRRVDIVAWWKTTSLRHGIDNALEWEDAPVFHQLVPVGTGGSILKHNRIKVSMVCNECRGERYSLLDQGIIIDKSQWDGSDIFTVREFPGLLFITERFVHWLSQKGITNYQVIRAVDFSFCN